MFSLCGPQSIHILSYAYSYSLMPTHTLLCLLILSYAYSYSPMPTHTLLCLLILSYAYSYSPMPTRMFSLSGPLHSLHPRATQRVPTLALFAARACVRSTTNSTDTGTSTSTSTSTSITERQCRKRSFSFCTADSRKDACFSRTGDIGYPEHTENTDTPDTPRLETGNNSSSA